MDVLAYEESIASEATAHPFYSKQWVYCNDSNASNYSNQIVLDTTSLSSTGSYIGWIESYIIMPLAVQLTSNTAASIPAGAAGNYDNSTDWCWAFKNGYWQMLHSMSVEFNNSGVVQSYPFLNIFTSFKAQTTFSKDDVQNFGDSIGFHMDSASSWTYNNIAAESPTVPTSCGGGLANNRNASYSPCVTKYDGDGYMSKVIYPASPVAGPLGPTNAIGAWGVQAAVPAGTPVYTQVMAGATSNTAVLSANRGMYERQQAMNNDAANGINTTDVDNYTGQGELMPYTSVQQNWRSIKTQNTVAGVASWNVYAKLRLKDLSDFFAKMPMLKGATCRFIFNTNQSIVHFSVCPALVGDTATIDPTGAAPVASAFALLVPPIIYSSAVNVVGGMTNPLMVAAAGLGQGSSSLKNDTYQLSVSIYKNNFVSQGTNINLATTALQSCRLYAPLYKMDKLTEARYIAPKTKVIEYNEVVSYQFNSIPTLSTFNVLVSQGLKNIQSVLCVPLIGSNANGPLAYTANPASVYPIPAGLVYTVPADWQLTDAANPPSPHSTLLSPFSTTGGTPDPIILNNFQVQIAGVSQLLNPGNYDFEMFTQHLASSNQINGGMTNGLSSGLISESDFMNLYRYYYVDCHRQLAGLEGENRSINVLGRNMAATAIDLLVFVECKRRIVVDLETGARV